MTGWGWIAFTALISLLAVQSWYYIEKVWALHRSHERHLEHLEAEYAIQTMMMKKLTLPMVGGDNERLAEQGIGETP